MKRAPKFRVASVHYKGPWKETILRREFAQLARWARAQNLRPGR
ncbi:MAG: hypothetical protein WAN74_00215 [Thermoplasmata archaeon]